MMNNIPTTPKPANPVLFDRVISEVQDILESELSWLDYAFGRAQDLIRTEGDRDLRYPAAYIRRDEYQSLEPNQNLGNFSFFLLNDPDTVDFQQNQYNRLTSGYSLIFWLNIESLGASDRNTENVKADILRVLTRVLRLTSGSITVDSISEKAENIYRGYSLREIDSQYLMHPYVGFRFEGTMYVKEICN